MPAHDLSSQEGMTPNQTTVPDSRRSVACGPPTLRTAELAADPTVNLSSAGRQQWAAEIIRFEKEHTSVADAQKAPPYERNNYLHAKDGWTGQVNDQTRRETMQKFYEDIKSGKPPPVWVDDEINSFYGKHDAYPYLDAVRQRDIDKLWEQDEAKGTQTSTSEPQDTNASVPASTNPSIGDTTTEKISTPTVMTPQASPAGSEGSVETSDCMY